MRNKSSWQKLFFELIFRRNNFSLKREIVKGLNKLARPIQFLDLSDFREYQGQFTTAAQNETKPIYILASFNSGENIVLQLQCSLKSFGEFKKCHKQNAEESKNCRFLPSYQKRFNLLQPSRASMRFFSTDFYFRHLHDIY